MRAASLALIAVVTMAAASARASDFMDTGGGDSFFDTAPMDIDSSASDCPPPAPGEDVPLRLDCAPAAAPDGAVPMESSLLAPQADGAPAAEDAADLTALPNGL